MIASASPIASNARACPAESFSSVSSCWTSRSRASSGSCWRCATVTRRRGRPAPPASARARPEAAGTPRRLDRIEVLPVDVLDQRFRRRSASSESCKITGTVAIPASLAAEAPLPGDDLVAWPARRTTIGCRIPTSRIEAASSLHRLVVEPAPRLFRVGGDRSAGTSRPGGPSLPRAPGISAESPRPRPPRWTSIASLPEHPPTPLLPCRRRASRRCRPSPRDVRPREPRRLLTCLDVDVGVLVDHHDPVAAARPGQRPRRGLDPGSGSGGPPPRRPRPHPPWSLSSRQVASEVGDGSSTSDGIRTGLGFGGDAAGSTWRVHCTQPARRSDRSSRPMPAGRMAQAGLSGGSGCPSRGLGVLRASIGASRRGSRRTAASAPRAAVAGRPRGELTVCLRALRRVVDVIGCPKPGASDSRTVRGMMTS